MTEDRERNERVLGGFVERARRVEKHSLAADRTRLLELAQGTMKVVRPLDGGAMSMRFEGPDEETLESAMARVRPMIMNDDPIYWSKTLKSIGNLTRDASDHVAITSSIRNLKKSWNKATTSDGAQGYTLQVLTKGSESQPITDAELADSWMYGDVIHAKENPREAGRPFGIKERYRAGAMHVARIMVHTIMTLNLVRDLEQSGALRVPAEAWTVDVVVPETTIIQEMSSSQILEATEDSFQAYQQAVAEAIENQAGHR